MSATPESSIGEVVADDVRAAAVFERLGIDFACGGGRTVVEACHEHGLEVADVLAEVTRACARPDQGEPHFSEWEPDALIAHIVGNHHAYVRQALPAIEASLAGLVADQGARHPELKTIADLFATVAVELRSHMLKEEGVLFPIVLDLVSARGCPGGLPRAPFRSIEQPVRIMEAEHASASRAMTRIRQLSKAYEAPPGAGDSYRRCMEALLAFERDLRSHLHLEAYVLFPKALALADALAP